MTPLDAQGQAHMVDVGEKPDTKRVAVAKGRVVMTPQTLELVRKNEIAKGDVLTVAQVAGIAAAKRASELIPLCHPLLLTNIQVDFDFQAKGIEIKATVEATGKTGVEMEALTAVAVSALTIYDMCKAQDRVMRIQDVRLVKKSGGMSGEIVLE